jgi:thioredoxin reductase (NADPH)
MRDIAIVGGGAAGLTAAIYAARANLKPLLIAGPLPGGLLTQTSDVENYPGFPEAVNGFELMFKFQQQAERFGSETLNDTVVEAQLKNGGPHTLKLGSGDSVECLALIVATGSSPRWMGLEGEKKFATKGVSACATCDGAFFKNVPVVVVGGGDTAMEEANFLTRFASKVYIMADRALKNPKIEVVWNAQVSEIFGNADVEGVKVRNLLDNAERVIECKGYFAALGHDPNTQVFKGQLEMDQAGFIALKGHGSQTSVEGVFSAGDCADHVYQQAVTAAGMGCRAAIDAARWLESKQG